MKMIKSRVGITILIRFTPGQCQNIWKLGQTRKPSAIDETKSEGRHGITLSARQTKDLQRDHLLSFRRISLSWDYMNQSNLHFLLLRRQVFAETESSPRPAALMGGTKG